MGLMDAFNPEDRVQVAFSDFYSLMKNSARADLMLNGIKNKIDHDAIYTIMTGDHIPVENAESEDKKMKTRK